MVVKFLIQKRYIHGLALPKQNICEISHKKLWQFINDRIASISTMNALNKSSELWNSSNNRKARPVVGEQKYFRSNEDILKLSINNKASSHFTFSRSLAII